MVRRLLDDATKLILQREREGAEPRGEEVREIDARPVDRMAQERQALQPLPNTTAPATGPIAARWPRERLQRSPQVYQQLFEVRA